MIRNQVPVGGYSDMIETAPRRQCPRHPHLRMVLKVGGHTTKYYFWECADRHCGFVLPAQEVSA